MKKTLTLVSRILIIIMGFFLVGINLAMAYILFAPDTMPKPFYLMYVMPSFQTTPSAETTQESGKNPSSTVATVEQTVNPAELTPGQGLMIDTGSKIVNLVDPTGRKYLRVGVVLEFAPTDVKYYKMSEEEKKTFVTAFNTEMDSRLPVINDVLITLFTSQTFDLVYTAEGKESLRTKIKTMINKQLPEYHVIYVYFTEFVVQ
jgi:flagellar basal body-associated protein FliL